MYNLNENETPIIVSVSGCSGSGKSTFVKVLSEKIKCYLGVDALHFNMDDYYKDKEDLASYDHEPNFDDPSSIHIREFIKDLMHLKNHETIKRPSYDFKTSSRVPDTYTTIEPSPVIIVDGIFSLCFDLLQQITDCRIFLDVSLKTCLQRRIERDLIYRGRSTLQSEHQWYKTVLPMYIEHIHPRKNDADFIIDWNEYNKKGIYDVLQAIDQLLIKDSDSSMLKYQYQSIFENGELH